jgi:putative endonuclease
MHRDFQPTVYLLASGYNGTLYLGVTSNLMQRVAQHRAGTFEGFFSRYGVHRLVWFEQHSTMEQAILREKRIKKWRRAWKVELIEAGNSRWRDLAEDFGFEALRQMDSRVRGNDDEGRGDD